VAQEPVSKRYKIGISSCPERRIKELNVGNPEALILVHAYQAREKYQSENLAHNTFSDKRLKGEWFKSNIELNQLPSFNG